MKIIYHLLLWYTMLSGTYSQSCPTCVGRISRQSEPFFSDVCYCDKSKNKNNTPPRPIKTNTKPTVTNKK
jgi:hypothetical protein